MLSITVENEKIIAVGNRPTERDNVLSNQLNDTVVWNVWLSLTQIGLELFHRTADE